MPGAVVEAAVDQRAGIGGAQVLRQLGISAGRAEPEGDAVIFRQMAVERHKLVDALAQAGDAVILAAGNDDQPAGRHALEGLGDAQLVLAAMAAGKHQRHVEAVAFGLRRDVGAGACSARKYGRKPCTRCSSRLEAFRQPKARLGAEEEHALALSRQGKTPRPRRDGTGSSARRGRDIPSAVTLQTKTGAT